MYFYTSWYVKEECLDIRDSMRLNMEVEYGINKMLPDNDNCGKFKSILETNILNICGF